MKKLKVLLTAGMLFSVLSMTGCIFDPFWGGHGHGGGGGYSHGGGGGPHGGGR